ADAFAARIERGDGGRRMRGRHEAALQRQRQAGAAEHAEDREERNDSEYEGEIKKKTGGSDERHYPRGGDWTDAGPCRPREEQTAAGADEFLRRHVIVGLAGAETVERRSHRGIKKGA